MKALAWHLGWFLSSLGLMYLVVGCAQSVQRAASPTPVKVAATVAPAQPAVKDYLSYMEPKLAAAGQNLGIMGRLAEQLANDPGVYRDARWKGQMANALDVIRGNGQKIQAYPSVPPEALPLDGMLSGLGQDLVYIADEMGAGLDLGAPERLQNAVQRMQTMNAKMPKAQAEIERLVKRAP